MGRKERIEMTIDIVPGQVWQDRDKREPYCHRRMIVIGMSAGVAQCKNEETGRITLIKVTLLRTRFNLLEYAGKV